MSSPSLFEGLTARLAVIPTPDVTSTLDRTLAAIEKNLDRTSEAFTDAVSLLERCLPPSFGA